MDAIQRLLRESDDVVPVMVPSTTILDRQRRARRRFREGPPQDRTDREGRGSQVPTRESLRTELRQLAMSIREAMAPELDPIAERLEKLVEAINNGAFVAFDASLSLSTVRDPNVVTRQRPPEDDPVLAAILGKEAPPVQPNPNSVHRIKPPQQQQQQQDEPPRPTQQGLQKAMEDAMMGRETQPKMQLVESSDMALAAGILQTGSDPELGGGVPLLGSPPSGDSTKIWGAFKRFAASK